MRSLTDLPWLLLISLSRRCTIDGFDICVAGSAAEAAEVFRKVDASLQLICSYDPALFGRMRADVRHFLFTEEPGGHYLAGIRTCRIGIGYARRVPVVELAMMMVHEATHAHLDRAGLRYRGAEREKIERACVEAEIAFAQAIPGSEDAVNKTQQLLARAWWAPAQTADDAFASLRARGVPVWLAKRIARRAMRNAE